jgi:UDP-glucose 4-epimerase
MKVNTLEFSKKRCLVLGGKGFIGSHLVDRLTDMGFMVRVFDRPADSGDNVIESQNNVEIYKGDFVNESNLEAALQEIDYVFHLISTTTPKTSNENPVYDVETNLVGTLKLLNLVKRHKNLRFIFISSGGTVYGIPTICPIPEKHLTQPICSYGVCKLTIENYLHAYHHLYGLDYVVLRVSNPYGEKQNPKAIQGAVSVFMLKLLENKKITIWGNGTVSRDFIYIGDVIDALVIVMQKEFVHKVFNIGSGVATTLNDLIDTMKNITGYMPDVEYLPSRDFDVPVNYLDISRAYSELGWKPKTSLTEGLKRTWSWIRSEYAVGKLP